jgi:biotin carboxylase
MKKKILIIGASWEQIPLIKAAKKLGCEVVATAPTINAEGFAYSDHAELADPRDLKTLLDIAHKFSVNAVTADSCDYSNYAAMFLRNKMGWRNYGMDAVQVTTNKHWMRLKCSEQKILQPKFFACRTYLEVCEAAQIIRFPLIIKPADNRGSFGVTRVDNASNLEGSFLNALINAHSREVLVEEHIDGTHLTIDGYMNSDGRHINLGIASKKVTCDEIPIITEVLYPADIDSELIKNAYDVNDRVIEALEIKRGLTHSEYIVNSKGDCYLVETANRGGGVLTSGIIIPLISGVNLPEILILEALDLPFDISPSEKPLFAMLDFLAFEPGVVDHVDGILEAESHPNIAHIKMMFNKGDLIGRPQSGAGRHGFAIYTGNSLDDLRDAQKIIKDTIKINYVKN